MLSAAEKAAGRSFLDGHQAALDLEWKTDPDAAKAPPFLCEYRHDCPTKRGKTQSLRLHEVYVTSPPYEGVPAGFFAFIYQAGQCPDCKLRVRSGTGRLVLASERPPLERQARV